MTPTAPRARPPVGAWLAVCVLLPAIAGAGMVPLSGAVPDFQFNGNAVDYDLSLRHGRLTLNPENMLRFTVQAGPGARDETPLRLRAGRRGGELLAGQFNVFGSLTPARDEAVTGLVTASVAAMQAGEQGDLLGFMLVGKPATGTLAQQFRNLGVYTSVAGVPDEDYWAAHDGGGSLMSLRPAGGVIEVPAGSVQTPLPATPLLLAAGLGALVGLRRQASLPGAGHFSSG